MFFPMIDKQFVPSGCCMLGILIVGSGTATKPNDAILRSIEFQAQLAMICFSMNHADT